jgi:glycosyltransferase involved in cell wall biosynthesis
MNILFSITAYPPSTGGAQLYLHMLARHVSKKHHVQVVNQWDSNRTDWLLGTTLLAPEESHRYQIDGINVSKIGLRWQEKLRMLPWIPIYYPLMRQSINVIAQYLKPYLDEYAASSDLIHNVRVGREPLSYASHQLAKQYDIPFVFTPVHHPRWTGWRYKAYIELYKNADALLALTEAEKQTLVGLGVSDEQIFVTGMGPILADRASPKRFLNNYEIDGPFVLFLGQHYAYKGYRQILEATSLVWREVPEAHFVFIGPEVGQSEKYFSALNDPRIHRLGKVDLQEKTDALAACALLCVPSTQESFGGVYTEAWSFGKPVIGCDIPAVSEVITNGVDGFLVKQKPNMIANSILELLLNTELAKEIGRRGRRKVQNRFSWNSIANRTVEIYRRLL